MSSNKHPGFCYSEKKSSYAKDEEIWTAQRMLRYRSVCKWFYWVHWFRMYYDLWV